MTSSDGAGPQKPGSKYGRRIKWLGVAIVVVIALYTGGWFYVGNLLETQVGQALAQAERNGAKADCANLRAHGYPFRIGLFCDSVTIEQQEIALSAGAFRSAAQVYDPARIIAELDGPLTISLPGLPYDVSVEWGMLRASSRLAAPLPSRISIEGGSMRAEAQRADGRAVPIATADHLELHMRTREADADLAARFSGLDIRLPLGEGDLPPATGLIDLAIEDGVAFLAQGGHSLRGRSGELRMFDLSLGPEAGLTMAGPVSVGADGLLDADLSLTLRNPKRLAQILGDAAPDVRSQIETALSGFASTADASGKTPALPVRITRGELRIGFLPVGRIPPLD